MEAVRPHLASLVEDFRRHSGETAVVAHSGTRRYATTYGELAELAGRVSAYLAAQKIGPGDRVLLWGENSAAWIAVFFGCLLRGVIAVPLDAAGNADFATRIAADTRPRLIAGDRHLIAQLNTNAAGINTPNNSAATLAFADLDRQLPRQPLYEVDPAVTLQSPFQIVFTSGTTSEPKGIVHTHRNVLASLQPIENEIAKYRRYERWMHPLRFLHNLPLSHVFGQFLGLWIPAVLAAELNFTDRLDPARLTELLKRERISVLIAVPRVLELLRAHLLLRFPTLAAQLAALEGVPVHKRWWRTRRIHSTLGWKFWAIISGGATLPADLEEFYQRLGLALIQGYGMTETAALVTLNHPFHIGKGTIGKPLPGREVRLSPEGEIQVRGDMISKATWQNGQLRPREDDWLSTGDLASRNDAGELRFLGRKSDVIVTAAGLNIHPADLETALAAQPGMREAAVVGLDTPRGPEPAAVVLFTGTDAQLAAAVQSANSTLADFQQIRRTLRWPQPELPRTSTGKLLRRKVAEWAQATLTGQPSANAPSNDALLNLIAEISGEHTASADDSLRLSEDLHLDSLGRVQLQSAIEQRLHTEVDEDAIVAAQTLGDLRQLLSPEPVATSAPPSSLPSVGVPSPQDEPIYPEWPNLWPVRALRILFLECVLRPLVWLLAAPRVTRPANLPDGPLLLIANHVTTYDGPLALYALPGKLRRRTATMMSARILLDLRRGRNQDNALLNLLAPVGYLLITALFRVFPLPSLRGFRRSFAHAGEAMDRGDSILLFPEGTRSHGGPLAPFRPGIGLLAQESRVPVVPIALVGVADAARSGRWFRSGRIEVRIGEPIAPDDAATAEELTARYEAALRGLLGGDSSRTSPPESASRTDT